VPPPQDDLIRAITDIVSDGLDLPAAALTAQTDIRSLAGVDSVKVLRTIAQIERTYDVELDDEDVFAAASVADLAAVVEKTLTLESR
jgi:acyl carrier protein